MTPNDTLECRPEYRATFRSLEGLEPPRVARALGRLVLGVLVVTGLFLAFTPWVQTTSGYGQVMALDPARRVQSVTALVGGRIKTWHVRDGQRVKKGDPLVDIEDNDPRYVERLQIELDAARTRIEAARIATQTALLDVQRRQRLFDKGLAARRDVELARIRHKELTSAEATAAAALAKAETALSRQATQHVTAPLDGTVLKLAGGAESTLVKEGDVLVQFAPDPGVRAVEVYVNGLDAALVQPGQHARLSFEGWPIVQFSGWPSVAIGTFGGRVTFVDTAVSANGLYRVMIVEPAGEPWPDDRYLRLGGRAQGWVLLNEVRLGYEVWRRLNSFPPQPTAAASSTPAPGKAPVSASPG